MSFKSFLENTSLEYHEVLNPNLWSADSILQPRIKLEMLKVADRWKEYVNLKDSDIIDIIFTGGNANFNYTKSSDIDIHLIVDMKKLNPNDDKRIIDYFLDKKALWLVNHHVTIIGYSVEPYVQAATEPYPKNQGVYSLVKNDWIQKPTYERHDWDNDKNLNKKIDNYKRAIDMLIEKGAIEKLKILKERLRDMRSKAISSKGEFSTNNLIFKSLRNQGYLDKMSSYIKNEDDKQLSLFK